MPAAEAVEASGGDREPFAEVTKETWDYMKSRNKMKQCLKLASQEQKRRPRS